MQGPTPNRNQYGRRRGKTLKAAQRRRLEQLLPRLALAGVHPRDNPDRAPIDPAGLWGGRAMRELWLEIGFGGGEHMVHQARANPDVGLIGAEPFVNGVAIALGHAEAAGVTNLRIHMGDVRDLFDVLPAGTLARVFLLYPDPWPKTRHHRRRFVTPEYLAPLARVLRPGAEFRIATDIDDYVRQALDEVPAAGFALARPDAAAWRVPWADWTRTRYEAKALREGRLPQYLTFHRL